MIRQVLQNYTTIYSSNTACYLCRKSKELNANKIIWRKVSGDGSWKGDIINLTMWKGKNWKIWKETWFKNQSVYYKNKHLVNLVEARKWNPMFMIYVWKEKEISIQAESNSELLFHIKRSTDIVILDGTCIPTSLTPLVSTSMLCRRY